MYGCAQYEMLGNKSGNVKIRNIV